MCKKAREWFRMVLQWGFTRVSIWGAIPRDNRIYIGIWVCKLLIPAIVVMVLGGYMYVG